MTFVGSADWMAYANALAGYECILDKGMQIRVRSSGTKSVFGGTHAHHPFFLETPLCLSTASRSPDSGTPTKPRAMVRSRRALPVGPLYALSASRVVRRSQETLTQSHSKSSTVAMLLTHSVPFSMNWGWRPYGVAARLVWRCCRGLEGLWPNIPSRIALQHSHSYFMNC